MLETWVAEDLSTQVSELELELATSLVAQGPGDTEVEKQRNIPELLKGKKEA